METEECETLGGGESSGCDWTGCGSCDAFIEILVPEVVDGAACSSHDVGAEGEEGHHVEHGREGDGWVCVGGHGDGPGAGEEEEVGAYGFVVAGEVVVWCETGWDEGG